MKNIEKMLDNCGIAYEVLSENDRLNKLANTLRKTTVFDMLKDDRTLFFYVVVMFITMALSFIKGYPVLSFVTIVFIVTVAIQLIFVCIYIKDATVLYKSRTYYKLLTDEHNAAELAKMIYDNVSRTAYKVNGESYMKNRLHKSNFTRNNNYEIILIAFGDYDNLSNVPMMIADM